VVIGSVASGNDLTDIGATPLETGNLPASILEHSELADPRRFIQHPSLARSSI